VLHLVKMWLECPVEETDDRGRKTRTTEARDNRRGIPQGSPISPLLANIYMRRFVLRWKKLGLEQRLGSRIVTYADDLVILCKKGKASEALQQLRKIMSKLELTVNEEKTRICKVPRGPRAARCAARGSVVVIATTRSSARICDLLSVSTKPSYFQLRNCSRRESGNAELDLCVAAAPSIAANEALSVVISDVRGIRAVSG
jgi:Reverse transcriptase (RNA-dependent DNA polymerase)